MNQLKYPLRFLTIRQEPFDLTSTGINHALTISKVTLRELEFKFLALQSLVDIFDRLLECQNIDRLELFIRRTQFETIVKIVKNLPALNNLYINILNFENVSEELVESFYMVYYSGGLLSKITIRIPENNVPLHTLFAKIKTRVYLMYERDQRFVNKMPNFTIVIGSPMDEIFEDFGNPIDEYLEH
jgi:hypothetical protein